MKFTKRGREISQAGTKPVPTQTREEFKADRVQRRKRVAKIATLRDGTEMSYADYIVSPHWRSRHPDFLRAGKYRCSFMFWLKIGKGKRYACHHKNYDHLGQEVYHADVIILHPWIHMNIVHGILSRFKSASRQATPYPNRGQRLFHLFCGLPHLLKVSIWFVVLAIATVPPVLLISVFNPHLGLAIAIGLAAYSLLQSR